MKTTSKNLPSPPHLDNHATTDVKLEMITRSGITNDKYDVPGIAHARTDRKDDIFMQRRLYIDEAHTALDIFPTAPPIRPLSY